MIHKNKIFVVFTFIITCFMNMFVYAGQEQSSNVECGIFNYTQCQYNTDYCDWSDGQCVNRISGTNPVIDDPDPTICGDITDPTLCAQSSLNCEWCLAGKFSLCVNTGFCSNNTLCDPDYYWNGSGCTKCPNEFPKSTGGRVGLDACYKNCNGTKYYSTDLNVPCDCFETQSGCEGTNRCEFDNMGICSACGGIAATYLDTTTHQCTPCPVGYDNADEGAVGSDSCYQNCNACNTLANDVDNDCSPGADKVHPGTSCSYTYKCATGYYANGTSSAPNCTQCTNGPGPNYYTHTETGLTSNNCPWTITCPTGNIFSGNSCTGCDAHNHSSWGTSSQITVKNYATASSPESICATDSTHSACTTNNLPVCEPNVYTVTLNKNASVVHNTPTGTLYQKYGTGWYTNAAATEPLNTLVIPSTPNLFMGYYTEQQQNPGDACTGTMVFDSDGSPVKNDLGGNTTLYACYGEPIQYNITITNGSKTFTKNGCENPCDLDNLASTLTTNDGTYIKTITYNAYGSIAWDGTKFTFTPNTNGINYINSSTNKLITLNNVTGTCQSGYYCDASMRQQKCPFGTTSNATGARAVTDCKYFADETWFRDSNSTSNTCSTANKCFQLSINGGGTVEISDTLKALLNK